jgi:hypothetical protein
VTKAKTAFESSFISLSNEILFLEDLIKTKSALEKAFTPSTKAGSFKFLKYSAKV